MLERNYGDRGEAVRAMPCVVERECVGLLRACFGPIQAAHVTARGMGGCNGDRRSLVSLCAAHHRQQGDMGVKSFERLHEIDLTAEAERIAAILDECGIA